MMRVMRPAPLKTTKNHGGIDVTQWASGRIVGKRNYELTDHLGNVPATVLDRKTGHISSIPSLYDYYLPDLGSATDYYPGGMPMSGRSLNGDKSPNGYNGKRNDNEVYGTGNFQDYGMRGLDARLMRFWGVDPLTKQYPWYTPYQFAGNTPIEAIDLDGEEEYHTRNGELIGKYGTNTEIRIVADNMVERARGIVGTEGRTRIGDELNFYLYNNGSTPVFRDVDKMVMDWGRKYNGRSIMENTEYKSNLFSLKINNMSFVSYSIPEVGDEASVTTKFKFEAGIFGSIHSHAAFDMRYKSNSFSKEEGDIGIYNSLGIRGFITTPNGTLKSYTNGQGEKDISTEMPSDDHDPTRKNNIPATPPPPVDPNK